MTNRKSRQITYAWITLAYMYILMIYYVFITLALNTTYGNKYYHANLARTIILVNDIFRDNWCANACMCVYVDVRKFNADISRTNKSRFCWFIFS